MYLLMFDCLLVLFVFVFLFHLSYLCVGVVCVAGVCVFIYLCVCGVVCVGVCVVYLLNKYMLTCWMSS